MISQQGTLLLELDLALAYRILPQLTVGVSLQNMFVKFTTLSSITSYNGALSSGPEDPSFDSLSQMNLVSLFNPSAKFGLIYQPLPSLKLGLSLNLPVWVRGNAQVNVQLPVAPLYEKSIVEGDTAQVRFTLPLVLRAAAEYRPIPELRLELGVDWEQWSALQAIEIEPQDIFINNLPTIDRYKVPTLAIPLNLRDTVAVRLGGEYFFSRIPLVLRAGYIFELGAAVGSNISVLALDFDKHVITFGLGYTLFGFRLDLALARSFAQPQVVDFRDSNALQVNPINPKGAVGVGGGSYSASYLVLGLGVSRVF